MYIFNTCHPKARLVQEYPPVVPTADCWLCGERVRLSPIEVLTNQTDLESGSYMCPICRRLVADADRSILDELESGNLFPHCAVFPFSTRMMNEMEDRYDRNEEESDSDRAVDDECEGACSMCQPSDKALMQQNAAKTSLRLNQILAPGTCISDCPPGRAEK